MVLVGGFVFKPVKPDTHDHYINDARRDLINLPSLHVIGDRDAVVKPATSTKLEQLFHPQERTTLRHDGGDYLTFMVKPL